VDVEARPHLVEIVAALKEITARITSATSLTEAVTGLLKVTANMVPAQVQCGLTLISQGEPATFTSTGLVPEVLDEASHAGGDGPCMDAIRTRDVVMSADLADEARWPVWSGVARRHGVLSVLSYPFDIDGLTLGALNLYAERPRAFDAEVPIIAMLIADHASLLLRVRMNQFAEVEVAHLADGGGAGVAVERAIGIVMAQRGCPPQQALRHLHDAATNLGVGLPAVAERLVRTVSDRGTAGPAN
jgi:transcriptional regulator with GAF, ATPase, and Fis domain